MIMLATLVFLSALWHFSIWSCNGVLVYMAIYWSDNSLYLEYAFLEIKQGSDTKLADI
jgi:hypothetical protein